MRPSPRLFLPGFLAVSLGAVYLLTLAPDITWANNGADGGDLITAAATGGVAHPGGYPLYLLLARIFQLLPFGALAFRTNLMSAFFAAAAALIVYFIVLQELSLRTVRFVRLPALTAAYACGLSTLLWSQAVITEVYSLQASLVAAILFLSSGAWRQTPPGRMDCLRGGVLGLAMGNHLTTLLLVPAAVLLNAVKHRAAAQEMAPGAVGWRIEWASIGGQLGCFLMGSLIYLTIPLRALGQAPVNWGNAITLRQLWWLITGELYREQVMRATITEMGGRLGTYQALLLQQFGYAGVVLGILGLVFFFRPTRLYMLALWTFLVSLIFAISYQPSDSYTYLIPAFLAFAIWIGFGTSGLMQAAARYSAGLAWGIGFAAMLSLLVLAWFHRPGVDASKDRAAVDFSSQVLAAAPANAIVIAQGDRAVFTMWYYHFALGRRADLVVIAKDLLHHDWYAQNLAATYPGLVLPDRFPWPETILLANPGRPACFIQYTDKAFIECSLPAQGP